MDWKQLLGRSAVGMALLGAVAGCSTTKVRSLGVADAAPEASKKGYVEFISIFKGTPFPLYQLDSEARAFPLAAIGLRGGERYSPDETGMQVVEHLRIAEPEGIHTYMIERNGQSLRAPVQAGRITPVEIEYHLIEQGFGFRLFRTDVRVLTPQPYQPDKLSRVKIKS